MISNAQSTVNAPMLKVEALTKNFGGLRAVHNIDLELLPGDLAGLIGPNGAGKTTVFNLITGVYVPTSGNIVFNGQDISGLAPHVINQMGLPVLFRTSACSPA
jgi:branched-chain amino acid transport system ATP-binding protein